ncbi:MAG: heme A synthase [Aureispira sp.]|nr:heme A synthase [Aureispira sp.]
MLNKKKQLPRSVAIWLSIGVFMVFMQVVIGGITRLTDSGLSITEWSVIQGTIPPLNAEQWEEARQMYMEHAVGQVKQRWSGVNYPDGIPIKEFKFIFFWEYFHRLWARTMGFVFLIPFIFFWRKKYFNKLMLKQLGLVVGLAALAAIFGWIMVMSGLDSPEYAWVDGYKLTIHLSIAIAVFGVLIWTTFQVIQPEPVDTHHKRLKKYAWRITTIICLQVVLGGLMSGLKAGLFYNNFPHMEVQNNIWIWIAEVLKHKAMWNWENVIHYNTSNNTFMVALVQLLHRGTAYLLCILIPIFLLVVRKVQASKVLKNSSYALVFVLVLQILLGVFTLLGRVPLWLGVFHQAGALVLLGVMLFVNYQFSKGGSKYYVKDKTKKVEEVIN